jgi:hypothetical protein
MGRQMDESLWEAWRRRLAGYEQWDGTVAAFCLREGVSTVAFYQWRRKLAGDVSGAESSDSRAERVGRAAEFSARADRGR